MLLRIIILKFRTYFRPEVSRKKAVLCLIFHSSCEVPDLSCIFFIIYSLYVQLSENVPPKLKQKYISHHFIAPRRHNLNSNSGRLPTPPPRTIHLTYKCQTTSKATSTRHYYFTTRESCQKGGVPKSMQHYQMLLPRKSPFKKVFLLSGEL